MKCNKNHGVFHLPVLHTTTEVMWEIPEDDSEEFRWSARPWVALRVGGPNGSNEKPEIAHDLPTLPPRWRKASFQRNTCYSTRPCENWWKKESWN